jgi:hypothetical protein
VTNHQGDDQDMAELARHTRQAEIAKTLPEITSLVEGSTALMIALCILERFPTTKSLTLPNGRKIGRTKVAAQEARESLREDQALDKQAVDQGVRAASSALTRAYDLLMQESSDSQTDLH